MIAAGIGCRRGCAAAEIVRVVTDALAAAERSLGEVRALYAPEWKGEERGLFVAAEQLGKELVLLAMPELRAQRGGTITESAIVSERFGLPSVAEAAALAGVVSAGEMSEGMGMGMGMGMGTLGAREVLARPRLLGARVVFRGATCALARLEPAA